MFSAIKRIASRSDALKRIALERWWDELRGSERARQPGRLIAHGRKTYSQNDEDGIVLEIFNRIGEGDRRFIEFGVQAGVECNTALLLMAGWSGLWLDGSDKYVEAAKGHQAVAVGQGRLTVQKAFVTARTSTTCWAPGPAARSPSLLTSTCCRSISTATTTGSGKPSPPCARAS
jgi:hypothetical protein